MPAKLTWKAHRRAVPLDLIEELERTLPPETYDRLVRNLFADLPTVIKEIDDPFERFFDTETVLQVGPFLRAQDYSPATQRTYGYLLTHLSDYMRTQGIVDPAEINIERLDHLFSTDVLTYSMRAQGDVYPVRPAEWKGSQRHTLLCAFRAYLRWLDVPEEHPVITMTKKDRKRLKVTAKQRKRTPEIKGGQARWLKHSDFLQLVEIAKTYGHKGNRKRNVALVRALWFSAARAEEFCNMKVQHLDTSDKNVWGVDVMAKGGNQETVAILAGAHKALREWLVIREKKFGMDPKQGPLWVNHHGHGLTRDGLQTIVRKLGTELGIAVSPHDFRRGVLRWLRQEKGVSYEDLQAFSRHKSVAVLELYLEGADRKPALRRLAAAVNVQP